MSHLPGRSVAFKVFHVKFPHDSDLQRATKAGFTRSRALQCERPSANGCQLPLLHHFAGASTTHPSYVVVQICSTGYVSPCGVMLTCFATMTFGFLASNFSVCSAIITVSGAGNCMFASLHMLHCSYDLNFPGSLSSHSTCTKYNEPKHIISPFGLGNCYFQKFSSHATSLQVWNIGWKC